VDQRPALTPEPQLRIDVEPALRDVFADMAAGRTLVIDYFASQRCGVVSGDLTIALRDGRPDGPFLHAAPVAGIPIVVEAHLRGVLEKSGPTLRLAGPKFRRRLAIELERPELWLDFLNQPGILRGRLWG